jgi:hypothetical protein
MQFLYADDHFLRDVGISKVKRASNVDYCNTRAGWIVLKPGLGNRIFRTIINGQERDQAVYFDGDLLFSSVYANRADAIEAEKKYLEEKMVS